MSAQNIQSTDTKLKVEGLVKAFPSRDHKDDLFKAVNNVSLSFKQGELTTLLGPSGCGKTTTLRMLAGFEYPSRGKVIIDDDDTTNKPPNKRDVGMVFQNYALFPHLTVFENVSYGLKVKKLHKKEIKEKTDEVLKLMGLEELKDRSPSQLSGGQQQRVAIARAIVIEPKILLFDEPLSNLDTKLRQYMRQEIRNLQQRLDITSVYVTHDQEEAMAISDQVVILNEGEIQQVGTPLEIYLNPVNSFVANFIGDSNILTGRLIAVNEEQININMEGTNIIVANENDNGMKVDEKVNCVIKPEFWSISEQGEFIVTVNQYTFLGSHIEYLVQLGNQTFSFFDYFHFENGIKEIGSNIKLSLRKDLIKVLRKEDE